MTFLWLKIAKTELLIWTSRFRAHRKLFFTIVFAFMGIYAFALVPLTLNAFHTSIFNLLTGLGPALPYVMYYIFSFVVLYIFLWCLTYPLSVMLQSTSDLAGNLEILLATPITPRDILFGKFIGRFPTYLIILLAIAPWLVNFFKIATPLSIFAQIGVYVVLFTVIILGLWLGNLLSAYMESKVRKSERSRDLGRAMTFLITIITVVIMYLMIYVMIKGIFDPTSPLYTILQGFPSTWGTIIIINLFNFAWAVPGPVIIFIGLLLGITLALLYVGYYAAGRFYSLEPVTTGSERIVSEKRFYRFFRKLMPGYFGAQFIAQLKSFSRRMENFSRIAYAIGTSIIIIVFNRVSAWSDFETNPIIKMVVLMMLTYLYAVIIAGMLGCFVIVGSKDHLWIYKKAPNGVQNYVKSVYLVNVVLTSLIGVIYSIIASAILGYTFLEGVMIVIFTLLFNFSLMAMAIGLAFIFPTFEERGAKLGILMASFMGISIGTWIVFLILGIEVFEAALFSAPLLSLGLTAVMGFLLLRLGIKKLLALE